MPSPRPSLRLDAAALTVVAATLLALVVPVVIRGGLPAGHDTPAHLTYTYLFDRALAEGQFPVRWIEWVREGHGQPLFNFYQPGLFYFVQVVHLAVPSLTVSLKLTILLLWWLGAGFMYMFLRRCGRLAAAGGALVFAFSPYLMLDVFVRCAYPELAGIVFAVGVLWALDGWLRTERPVWLAVLASLAGLMVISHPPASLIFSPLFAAYAGYLLVTRQTSVRSAMALLPAALLAVGLAAFYLFPAVAELHLIRSAELTQEGYDYHRHFVLPTQWVPNGWGFGASVEGAGDGISFQVGVGQWLAIAVAVVVAAVDLFRRALTTRTLELLFWLSVAAGAMFVMTRSSVGLWDVTAPLAFVQFPWRFLMLVAVAAAALSACLLSSISSQRLPAALVIAVAVVQVQLAHIQLQPRGYIAKGTMDIDWRDWRYSKEAQKSAFIENGYFPASLAEPPPDLERWTVTEGVADVTARTLKGHDLELDVTAEVPASLRINSPYFPGWVVSIDGQRTPTAVAGGYFSVMIPPGRHHVRAVFTNTPVRSWANAITLLSGATLLALVVVSQRRG